MGVAQSLGTLRGTGVPSRDTLASEAEFLPRGGADDPRMILGPFCLRPPIVPTDRAIVPLSGIPRHANYRHAGSWHNVAQSRVWHNGWHNSLF